MYEIEVVAMKPQNYWYVATIIMRSTKLGRDEPHWTCEEQIRVIRAPDAETAYRKAVELGKREELSYKNIYGETVTWDFVGLEDLVDLDGAIRDGTEIRYRFFRHADPPDLVTEKDRLSIFLAEQNRMQRESKIIMEQIPFDDED